MVDVFSHYCNVLDDLINDFDFFKCYFQNPFSLEEDIEDICGVDVRFGATRGCLVDSSYDYVVKFNLDESEYGSCEDEVTIYGKAEDCGLEGYFLRPRFLGTYKRKIRYYSLTDIMDKLDCQYFYTDFANDVARCMEEGDYVKEEITICIPLFAYPRAERYEYSRFDRQIDDFYLKTYPNSPLTERSTQVAKVIEEHYGTNIFLALSEFLAENEINDLHSGNLMCYNGMPCFSDYCGYCG